MLSSARTRKNCALGAAEALRRLQGEGTRVPAVELHQDIDGEPCDGELEVETDETLYCFECGAVVDRQSGELLGHGSPHESSQEPPGE